MKQALCLFVLLLTCSCVSTSRFAKQAKEPPFVFAAWAHGDAKKTDSAWRRELAQLTVSGIPDFFIGAGAGELGRMVRLGQKENIRIHGWVWTLNRPGDKIAQQHPDWYAVNRLGKNSLEFRAYVDYYQWLSPFSEGARQHIKENIETIANVNGLASVHLDYVRYCDVILATGLQPKYNLVQDHEMPQFDYGYHPKARTQFKKMFGVDPLAMKNPQLNNEWRQFRLNALTDLVGELRQIVHRHGKKLSAAVFPFPEMSRQMVRQDWAHWQLDIALPMMYHGFYQKDINWIGFCTQQGVRDLQGNGRLYSGLYLPALTPTELESAIRQARDNGAAGVSLFDLNALTAEKRNRLGQLSREFNE